MVNRIRAVYYASANCSDSARYSADTAASSQPTTPTTTITGTGTYTTPVDGTPRGTMSCLGTEGTVIHIHMYLEIYVKGQQVQVPANTGIIQDQNGSRVGGSTGQPLVHGQEWCILPRHRHHMPAGPEGDMYT